MHTHGINPLTDLALLWRFVRLLRHERPDVLLAYTAKPNVYGSFAAHLLGIPVVNNIAGLGAVFIKDSWLTSLVRGLYRLALSRSAKVFFQNNDYSYSLLSINEVFLFFLNLSINAKNLSHEYAPTEGKSNSFLNDLDASGICRLYSHITGNALSKSSSSILITLSFFSGMAKVSRWAINSTSPLNCCKY
jgi:hypothetical protein